MRRRIFGALGSIFTGLAGWRFIVFLWPSNGVYVLPAEMGLFVMMAWMCFYLAMNPDRRPYRDPWMPRTKRP